MRHQTFFTGNDSIGNLLCQFKISQENLYHYSNSKAVSNILKNKEIYLTRADHLFDNREVNYGLSILKKVGKEVLPQEKYENFTAILDVLKSRFNHCFIFCLTKLNESDKHIEIHGESCIEFSEDFPKNLANLGWHSIPISDDSYSLFYSTDLYKSIEGYSIYDFYEQQNLARKICNTYNETTLSEVHIVDSYHFVDILMNFIMLCKEPVYEWEREYRIGLITKTDWNIQFQNTSKDGKKYIKLRLPEKYLKKTYNNGNRGTRL